MKYYSSKVRGYTLVEIVTVVGIAAILLTIALAGYGEVRKSARDKQRVTDLQQIQLALRMYREKYGTTYPVFDNGVVIGSNSTLDASIREFLNTLPQDPLQTSDSTYQYYYDSKFRCKSDDEFHVVLYATKTENPSTANFGKFSGPAVPGICRPAGGGGDSNDGSYSALTYGILLGITP